MLTNSDMTFNEMIERFGETKAWHYLAEIEKAAQIRPHYSSADPEARLAHAYKLQDTPTISVISLAA